MVFNIKTIYHVNDIRTLEKIQAAAQKRIATVKNLELRRIVKKAQKIADKFGYDVTLVQKKK